MPALGCCPGPSVGSVGSGGDGGTVGRYSFSSSILTRRYSSFEDTDVSWIATIIAKPNSDWLVAVFFIVSNLTDD